MTPGGGGGLNPGGGGGLNPGGGGGGGGRLNLTDRDGMNVGYSGFGLDVNNINTMIKIITIITAITIMIMVVDVDSIVGGGLVGVC